MAVTLTTDAKNWIAQNLGISKCMTETAQSFTYYDSVNNITYPDSGGTALILNRLIDSAVTYVTIGGTQHTYAALKTQNNNVELVYPDDVQWVMAHDVGAAQYCYGICTPNALHCYGGDVYRCSSDGMSRSKVEDCPAGCSGGVCVTGEPSEKTETPPFEVYVGGGESCPDGSPNVLLDTSEAFAYFKAQPVPYVGVMEIDVTNLDNTCYAYFVWEMRMWDGHGYTECPPEEDVEWKQISRFLATISNKKVITLKRLNASETDMISGSFEIPSHFEGKKTICLSLWGNFDYEALVNELATAGYAKEIDWT